jgi:hypothetical protein
VRCGTAHLRCGRRRHSVIGHGDHG